MTQNAKRPLRFHIIGSVGSGKTTLARRLSQDLKIPYYELDNVVWKRSTPKDIKRTKEERDEIFRGIVNSDSWIIEGVHQGWTEDGFHNSDLIILLDTAYRVRTFRIVQRFLRQRIGIEKANYEPTLHMLRMMFLWSRSFEREAKPKILQTLEPHRDKVLILPDNTLIDVYLRDWRASRH